MTTNGPKGLSLWPTLIMSHWSCPFDSFARKTLINQQVFPIGCGCGELVAAFVLGMARMAAYPMECDIVRLNC